ncbi:transmembrane protein, putative (macronuclear) [Tetrahymena thermophila SB210]|uniref:Transmembrane protein, putative n=1 Tax=Tetrahymena thermophila (strain SB210) TaxID=312017 RepID=Q230V9_TETTS|nr:transmembrane protein, putative [Tetrahymena thermophila SB210]EAR91180.2 transmembrane protein, putative [Tetrahymena thermophila SB210]|eukprot:XP_001011425.2 transmembrane protein, putative [Tetrahymena thermophila SB210]
MKTIIAVALILGLAMSATLNIPLQTSQVYHNDANNVKQLVDEVLSADVDFTKQAQDQRTVIDLESNVNYLLSRQTQYNQVAVNPFAFDCTIPCAQGVEQTGSFTVLGGKVTVNGGTVLKGDAAIQIQDSEHKTSASVPLYVPGTVDPSTAAQESAIIQTFNSGLSFSKGSNNVLAILKQSSKLVANNAFSVYVHDTIAQLNVGGYREYFVQPSSTDLVIPTVNSNTWTVTINGIKIKSESQLQSDSQTLTAHFDLTSKYIYVPHVDAVAISQTPAFYYFMNSKQLPCFQPSSNLGNAYNYVCPADQFPGFDAYNPITFSFKGQGKNSVSIVLQPTDYINKLDNGNYELLFKFASAPQNTGDFYFGTTLLKKYYATFNADTSTVVLRNRYDVAVGNLILNDNYRIPVIVVGLVLALLAVILLVFVILKRVELEEPTNAIPMYSVYKPASPVVYQTSVNASNYVPTYTNSIIPAGQNVVVSSSQLRQSQTQVRQSQTLVRNSQQQFRQY